LMVLNVWAKSMKPEGKNRLLLTITKKAAAFAKTMPGFDKESVEYYLSKTKKMREEKRKRIKSKENIPFKKSLEENQATK